MNRPLRLILLGSLMLNLVLAGTVIGQVYRSMQPPPSHRQTMLTLLQESNLSPEKQASLAAKIQALGKHRQARRAEFKAASERMLALLEAEPFDAKAYGKELDKMFSLQHDQRQKMAKEIKGLAESLDAEQRKAFAEVLRKVFGKRWR